MKKTKKMLAIEAKFGRPFWQVVDRMARRSYSKAEAAEVLGYDVSTFSRMLSRHPDPIEWAAPHLTRRAIAARQARRGVCTEALRESMDRARAARREARLYDLHGFVGTVADHCERQGIPPSTVASRRADGWKLSEALGYIERKTDKRGFAVRRVEAERGKPFLEILREYAKQGRSTHFVAATLDMHHSTITYHVRKAGGFDALGFRKYAQPLETDRATQLEGWLKVKGRMLEHDGRVQHLNAWAEETGICASTIANRIDKGSWSVSDALTVPVGSRRRGFTKQRPARDHKWRESIAP